MTLKPSIWYPIAVVVAVLNLVGGGFAVGQGQPDHAAAHAGLAVVFGLWASRLRRNAVESRDAADRADAAGAVEGPEALEMLEGEVSRLRQELSELNERLDFAERMLARGPERRVDELPQR